MFFVLEKIDDDFYESLIKSEKRISPWGPRSKFF